jgi:hypothetical protein
MVSGFTLRVPRNDTSKSRHTFAFSRPVSPELCRNGAPSKPEGAGNAGCTDAPAALRAKEKHASKSPQVHRLTRHSLRDGFTVSFGLSPEIGLCCLRPQRDAKHHRKVDASVEASGPHDFAVRSAHIRLLRDKRPSHPAPNVRDDRDTPLVNGRETREDVPVICPTAQA